MRRSEVSAELPTPTERPRAKRRLTVTKGYFLAGLLPFRSVYCMGAKRDRLSTSPGTGAQRPKSKLGAYPIGLHTLCKKPSPRRCQPRMKELYCDLPNARNAVSEDARLPRSREDLSTLALPLVLVNRRFPACADLVQKMRAGEDLWRGVPFSSSCWLGEGRELRESEGAEGFDLAGGDGHAEGRTEEEGREIDSRDFPTELFPEKPALAKAERKHCPTKALSDLGSAMPSRCSPSCIKLCNPSYQCCNLSGPFPIPLYTSTVLFSASSVGRVPSGDEALWRSRRPLACSSPVLLTESKREEPKQKKTLLITTVHRAEAIRGAREGERREIEGSRGERRRERSAKVRARKRAPRLTTELGLVDSERSILSEGLDTSKQPGEANELRGAFAKTSHGSV